VNEQILSKLEMDQEREIIRLVALSRLLGTPISPLDAIRALALAEQDLRNFQAASQMPKAG